MWTPTARSTRPKTPPPLPSPSPPASPRPTSTTTAGSTAKTSKHSKEPSPPAALLRSPEPQRATGQRLLRWPVSHHLSPQIPHLPRPPGRFPAYLLACPRAASFLGFSVACLSDLRRPSVLRWP